MHGMELATDMRRAAAAAIEVVRNVGRDRFGDPTPDSDWDVRTLLNHLIHWSAFASEQVARKQPTLDGAEPDYAAGDFVVAFETQVHRAVRAWAAPGALDGMTAVGNGPAMPAEVVAGMFLGELTVHAWDLAKATGQDYQLPDDVAADLLGLVTGMAEMAREMKLFGAPVAVPDDATALDRALGLSGRDPAWQTA